MIKKSPLYIDYSLTTDNEVTLRSARNLFGQLNLGNRKVELKFAFLVCLLLNLKRGYEYRRNIIIPQDKEFYRRNTHNARPLYQTFHIVVDTIKELERKGFIKNCGYVIKHVISNYSPERSLIPYFSGYDMNVAFVHPPLKYVILRQLNDETGDYESSDKYIDIDYSATQLTNKMTNDLIQYNGIRESSVISLNDLPLDIFFKHKGEFLLRWSVDNLESLCKKDGKVSLTLMKSYLVRIFNRDFKRGGRFYRGVESNMPEELRRHIQINGKPTVELDYSGHHLRMLYHLKNIDLKKDPYAIEKNMTPEIRDIYKIVSLIGINAKDNTQALKALWKKLEKENLSQHLPDNLKATRQQLIDNFKEHNYRIKGYLFKQKCHLLMNIDSKISNDILTYFAKKGILALCVHDSYIIEKQHAKELLKVMRSAYNARLGFYPIIK